MSGFGTSPFNEADVNPFADPSVIQATHNASTAQRAGLDDFNPFADPPANRTISQTRGAANPPQYTNPNQSQPAIMQATQAPPAYSPPQVSQKITTDELERRQEELERKAAELARKEEALRNAPTERKNNWPPLPDKFCVQPCFFQDIQLEIPLEFQKIVKTLYYLWLLYVGVLFLNMLGGMTLLINNGDGTAFGLSLVYFIIFTPISYVCWFRPVYRAFKNDSSFSFFIFFFVFFFHCIATGVFAIGIPGGGACGLIRGLTVMRTQPIQASNYAVGTMLLIIGLLFAFLTLCQVVMLLKVHRLYRTTGMSFAKAQQEFTTGIMRNEHVQSAASDAAQSAVRNQFQSGGNRY